jgi:predicted nucleic acid-binding protein
MIILDTNVVSETMRAAGAQEVRRWLDAQSPQTLYLTATVLSELLVGVELISDGRRKQGLAGVLHEFVEAKIENRVLAFDEVAARAYASIVIRARTLGYSMPVADGQIAAVAAVHGFAVATRDTQPFEAAGVEVLNPWEL